MIKKIESIPFVICANCILVKGVERSSICDLQNGKIHLIPNVLYFILQEHNNESIKQIKSLIAKENHEVIDEYFDFLTTEGLIVFTEHPEFFPALNTEWDYPSLISNGIIDICGASNMDYKEIARQLDEITCHYIEIRIFSALTFEEIYRILASFEETTIMSINLIMKYEEGLNKEMLMELCGKYQRISGIHIYNSPSPEIIESALHQVVIQFSVNEISSEMHCGIINTKNFVSNIPHYTESLHHNTCLNRKISIDRYGNIKNCPSMKENYGNISDTSLKEAIEKRGFKKYWNITKDKIEVCKDCEFRHVCTDCRAYLENPDEVYSKPLKCGYNPYTCEWEEWSTNPLKQKAIDYYDMHELVQK